MWIYEDNSGSRASIHLGDRPRDRPQPILDVLFAGRSVLAHDPGGMVGTLVNTAAILMGGALGVATGGELSLKNQIRLRTVLALLTVYVGLHLAWSSIGGTIGAIFRQLVIVCAALILGNAIGKLFRIQRALNGLGDYARKSFENTQPESPNRTSEGFVTCSILFCVGPMAILGAVEDGLSGTFRILGLKAAMDGLATFAFSKTFGWGVSLAAIPVLAYQGTITLAARWIQPFLQDQALLDSIHATGGLLVLTITLVILDVRKVPLADYLPSLAVAPFLTWLFR